MARYARFTPHQIDRLYQLMTQAAARKMDDPRVGLAWLHELTCEHESSFCEMGPSERIAFLEDALGIDPEEPVR